MYARCTVQKKGSGVFVAWEKTPFCVQTAFNIDSRIPLENRINLFTEIPGKLSTCVGCLFQKREEIPEYFNISFFCLSIVKKHQKSANGAKQLPKKHV